MGIKKQLKLWIHKQLEGLSEESALEPLDPQLFKTDAEKERERLTLNWRENTGSIRLGVDK